MDRNLLVGQRAQGFYQSLSARRAWIEMARCRSVTVWASLLSARRAWIEIQISKSSISRYVSRSPQGERG